MEKSDPIGAGLGEPGYQGELFTPPNLNWTPSAAAWDGVAEKDSYTLKNRGDPFQGGTDADPAGILPMLSFAIPGSELGVWHEGSADGGTAPDPTDGLFDGLQPAAYTPGGEVSIDTNTESYGDRFSEYVTVVADGVEYTPDGVAITVIGREITPDGEVITVTAPPEPPPAIQTTAEITITADRPFDYPVSDPRTLDAIQNRARIQPGDVEQFFKGGYNGIVHAIPILVGPFLAPLVKQADIPKVQIDPRYGGAALIGQEIFKNLALEATWRIAAAGPEIAGTSALGPEAEATLPDWLTRGEVAPTWENLDAARQVLEDAVQEGEGVITAGGGKVSDSETFGAALRRLASGANPNREKAEAAQRALDRVGPLYRDWERLVDGVLNRYGSQSLKSFFRR